MSGTLRFGVRCKCGRLIPIRDAELEEFSSLEQAQHMLRRQGMPQKLAACSPQFGCKRLVPYTPENLELFLPFQPPEDPL